MTRLVKIALALLNGLMIVVLHAIMFFNHMWNEKRWSNPKKSQKKELADTSSITKTQFPEPQSAAEF